MDNISNDLSNLNASECLQMVKDGAFIAGEAIQTGALAAAEMAKKTLTPVAHTSLYVTSNAADLISKNIAVFGVGYSAFLLGDAINFSYNLFKTCAPLGYNITTSCGYDAPYTHHEYLKANICPENALKATDFDRMVNEQVNYALIGLALSPVLSLAFRKISQLATKLNHSF